MNIFWYVIKYGKKITILHIITNIPKKKKIKVELELAEEYVIDDKIWKGFFIIKKTVFLSR